MGMLTSPITLEGGRPTEIMYRDPGVHEALKYGHPIRLVNATFEPPTDTDHPEYTVPTEIPKLMLYHYGFTDYSKAATQSQIDTGVVAVDFMAGGGTLLKAMDEEGIPCEGIELSPDQFEIAKDNLPSHIHMALGDCITTVTASPKMRNNPDQRYRLAYFSPSFRDMKERAQMKAKTGARDPRLAVAVFRALAPAALAIIDSATKSTRDGQELEPVNDTIGYFVDPGGDYFDSLFNVVNVHPFEAVDPPEGCDSDFAQIVLGRRFDSLADVLHFTRRSLRPDTSPLP